MYTYRESCHDSSKLFYFIALGIFVRNFDFEQFFMFQNSKRGKVEGFLYPDGREPGREQHAGPEN
jgi:hypothetical protein